MRIVAGRINHETNTFSPVATDLAAFSPLFGQAARAGAETSSTALGAFAGFAASRGATLVVPVLAMAYPSGRVTDEAFESMADALCKAVAAAPCDAILLDLHGAMATASHDDGDGALLARVRALAPNVPIGVALDLHGNISERMVALADVIVGFKTYPHVDMVGTGAHVARLIGRMLDRGPTPHVALCHPPLLAQTLCMNTAVPGAMAELVAAARHAETEQGVLAATIFGGFSLADVPEAGLSVVVVAESKAQAESIASSLGALAWERRAELVYDERPLARSIADAAAIIGGAGPVLLLDHGDNCMSGGTCDVMDVTAAALAEGLEGIVAGPICDPAVVARLFEAGLGASVTVALGNKIALPGFPRQAPLALAGMVAALGDGRYTMSGPTYTGMRCAMGRAAVLDTGRARILVTEQAHEPWDLGVFTCVGLDPGAARTLILKSRMYCRPCFGPLARGIVECASAGVTSSRLDLFAFDRVVRPTYPLDRDIDWSSTSVAPDPGPCR